MCVVPSSALLSRAAFATVLGVAAAPLLGAPASALESAAALTGISVDLPTAPRGLVSANARAARIAAGSPFVRAAYSAAKALADSITTPAIRGAVLDIFSDPTPRYVRSAMGPEARERVRRRLLEEKLIGDDAPLGAIFPHTEGAAQPFWSTPGSGAGSHHAYPGGLLVHELFNARMASAFAHEYNAIYFGAAKTVDRDTVIGAAFFHDIMKAVVFAWTDDGVPAKEYQIAGTGGHHVLSGAEAIARGMSAAFVTVLLSAHAAPSLGDEKRVVDWCRAAAIVAGVDPVAIGLVRKTAEGYALAARYVPLEAFVNNLSDHDYVLSVPAMHDVSAQLDTLAPRYGIDPAKPREVAWWRNALLARTSAINLYGVLAAGGESAFAVGVAGAATTIGSF